MKLMNYEVVRRDSFEDLTLAVNGYINQGWELVGGVCVALAYSVYTNRDGEVSSDATTICAQAIRRADTSTPEHS
jgi:hypothetical protein